MTPELLCRCGIALVGSDEWQSGLAKVLQVNIRTIQRWYSGKLPMPESLREDLIEILGARRAACSEMLRQLIGDAPSPSSLRGQFVRSPGEP